MSISIKLDGRNPVSNLSKLTTLETSAYKARYNENKKVVEILETSGRGNFLRAISNKSEGKDQLAAEKISQFLILIEKKPEVQSLPYTLARIKNLPLLTKYKAQQEKMATAASRSLTRSSSGSSISELSDNSAASRCSSSQSLDSFQS